MNDENETHPTVPLPLRPDPAGHEGGVPGLSRIGLSVVAIAATMVALDAAWVGFVAKPAYDTLGSLKRGKPFLPAAGLFYAMYAVATYVYAVKPSTSVVHAARRAAGMGLVAYATYELTNAAIIRDWPLTLVPIDTAWGVLISAAAAASGRAVRRVVAPKPA